MFDNYPAEKPRIEDLKVMNDVRVLTSDIDISGFYVNLKKKDSTEYVPKFFK